MGGSETLNFIGLSSSFSVEAFSPLISVCSVSVAVFFPTHTLIA